MKFDIKYNLVDKSDILKVKKSEIHITLKEEMNFYEIFDILFSLYKRTYLKVFSVDVVINHLCINKLISVSWIIWLGYYCL